MLSEIRRQLTRNHGLITYVAATSLGLSDLEIRHLVRRGTLVVVRRGVLADGELWTALDEWTGRPVLRARAAHLVTVEEHVMSHNSAGHLWGLPMLDPGDGFEHVTREDVRGSRAKAGIKHHTAPYHPDQVVSVDGLDVLDLARTVADIGRQHGYLHGLVAADAARQLGVSLKQLQLAVEPMENWPGVRSARAAIAHSDPGAESVGETLMRDVVTSCAIELGPGDPQSQFFIGDPSGRFAVCDLRVGRHVFEFDGKVKFRRKELGGLSDNPEQSLWDEKTREDFVRSFRLGVSRVVWSELLPGARKRLRERLEREWWASYHLFGSSIDDLAPHLRPRRAG